MIPIAALSLLIVIVAGAVGIRATVLIAVVRGPSMRPTYHDGDRLIALRRRSVPRRGEVVVFRNPHPHGVAGSSEGPLLIKRVAAGPSEPAPDGLPCPTVPPGHFAVLGDNPAQSLDSRHLGFIPVTAVVAVVVRRIGEVDGTAVAAPSPSRGDPILPADERRLPSE